MTNEEKKAFFYANSESRFVWKKQMVYVELYMAIDQTNECAVVLRTIDSLTDIEAIEVAKLIWNDPHYHTSSYGRSQATLGLNSSVNFDQPITDYLRSIGVLVGFRHFTPEMLIAEGVVKIKEV